MAKRDKEQVNKNRQVERAAAVTDQIVDPAPKHRKKATGAFKRFGVKTTYASKDHKGAKRSFDWTRWYDTERAREAALNRKGGTLAHTSVVRVPVDR